jgi:hypothetical protein
MAILASIAMTAALHSGSSREKGQSMADGTHERTARLWKRTLVDDFLADSTPGNLRNVAQGDAPALAALFFQAFLGTIDDGGQTESQYVAKTTAILSGRYGEWIPAASWTVEGTSGLRSVCIVCDYKPYGCPVIAIVATMPAYKCLGDAGSLLDATLHSLRALGHPECCAMVTTGNEPSERLFASRGFFPVAA